MGRIHDGQTSVKVRSPPKNIGGYGTVSVWRSAHFYRPDRDRLQSLVPADLIGHRKIVCMKKCHRLSHLHSIFGLLNYFVKQSNNHNY